MADFMKHYVIGLCWLVVVLQITQGEECLDAERKPREGYCRLWKDGGLCGTHQKEMERFCRQTCGFCSSAHTQLETTKGSKKQDSTKTIKISSHDLTPKIIAEHLKDKNIMTVFKLFSIRSMKDITTRSEVPILRAFMEEEAKSYYQMNITIAFKLLGNVAQLLRVAYAGCKGYSCSTKVLEVLSSYQTLISESKTLSLHLVDVSIKAIRLHRHAHRYINEKRDNKSALRSMKKTIKLAKEMSKKSKEMADKSRNITSMSQAAMLDASKHERLSIEEKRNVQRRMKDERVNKQLIKTLKQMIKVDRHRIKDDIITFKTIAKEILESLRAQLNSTEELKRCELVDTLVKVNCVGVLRCLWKRYDTVTIEREFCTVQKNEGLLQDKRTAVERLRTLLHRINVTQYSIRQKQDNLTELYLSQYKSLETSLVDLKHSSNSQNDLVKAVHSLEIAVKALGIVKSAFEKAVEFWTSVVMQTEHLNNENLEDFRLELQEIILDSGFSWLTFGKVQLDASEAMKETVRRVDRNLMTLPTSEEVSHVINKEADGIINITRSLMERLYDDNSRSDVVLV